jgi:pilus assembly protein CpaC
LARAPFLAACALAAVVLAAPAPGAAPTGTAGPLPPVQFPKPAQKVTISTGKGMMIRLARPMANVFVASDAIADVQVNSPQELYLFGKGTGETTVYATDKAGGIVYSADVMVAPNYEQVGAVLRAVMPDAKIVAVPMNGLLLLKGTVDSPQEVEEVAAIAQSVVGKDITIVNRVTTVLNQQVALRVRVVEVNRAYAKSMGFNILTKDGTGGFRFGFGQGQAIDVDTGAVTIPTTGSVAVMAGKVLGVDLISALELAENDGFATTLAEPNLTAMSGETASFLAGGEIPIPVPQQQGNAITIEYKQYGVSLAFTPVVLSGGRISMRVRPEVSELTSSTVSIGGYQIPGLATRRAETTVELGSGQSFMIGGLISNRASSAQNKAPFLGDLPILGALFKSSSFKRDESELVIVVTPYLVKPLPSAAIATPVDGFRVPNDAKRMLGASTYEGDTGAPPRAPVDARPTPDHARGAKP